MSAEVFQGLYADLYDRFYQEKDYDRECDLLEEIFSRFGSGPVRTILDLGCGTGNHAIPLARRGYRVTGVDRSAAMLARAREKAGNPPPEFLAGDLRELNLGRRFDAVLMMFAVLSYQVTNAAVLAALAAVHRHLHPGGLLVADVWYGPGVLTQRPGDRVKVIDTADGQIIRAATATLDTYRHLCGVSYRLWRLQGDRVIHQAQETHQVRYFFPQELELFLSLRHLDLVHTAAFGNLTQPPDDTTWNLLIIGRSEPEAAP